MTPTLSGRIQSRIFFLVVVGGLWTLVFSPLLGAVFEPEASLQDVYEQTYLGLALVLVLGIGWEFVYHFLMQLRWEKDWPTIFGLLNGFNESILVYLVYRAVSDHPVSAIAFGVYFWTTWLLVWGSGFTWIRIVFPRWRFRGGSFF